MADFAEYEDHDALGLARLIAAGEVTLAEVLEAAIARTEARDPALNAVIRRLDDAARRRLEAPLPGGPLAGVPYLIKDLGACMAGVPTSGGNALMAEVPADHDSTVVTRLRAAGLVPFGKTNTPEFGLNVTTEPVAFGPTRNPWDRERSAGGSSGGAAAAVAAGMVPVAHASDGGGSIRIPAAHCGLFGLKPTRARVPLGPDVGEAWNGLATQHAITRSVRDSAALLDAAAGPEPGDPYQAPGPTRPYLDEVGRPPGRLSVAVISDSPVGTPVEPDCRAAVEDAAGLCADLGHTVEAETWPPGTAALAESMQVVVAGNLRAELDDMFETLGRARRRGDVEIFTELFAEQDRETRASDLVKAVHRMHAAGRTFAAFFRRYDVLLTPSLGQPPLPLGTLNTMDADFEKLLGRIVTHSPFTALANITGCPACSVPLHWSDAGLPIGTMFTAAFGDEGLLFRLASQLEDARPWWDRRPSEDGNSMVSKVRRSCSSENRGRE